jgi:hypothetical protein
MASVSNSLRLNRYNAPVKTIRKITIQIKWSLVTKLISGLLDKNENITAMVITNENTEDHPSFNFQDVSVLLDKCL